jgi:predicted nucleic acid-binding protein
VSLLNRIDLVEKIGNQHIIVDSNFWIQAYNYPEEFQEVFLMLSAVHCEIITLPSIEFEVLRSSKDENDYVEFSKFLENYSSTSNGIFHNQIKTKHQEISSRALDIARLYKKHHHYSASFIDCYIVSVISFFKNSHRVYILTENHTDFSSLLLDLLYIYPVATITKNKAYKIHTPGFYQISFDKLSENGLT